MFLYLARLPVLFSGGGRLDEPWVWGGCPWGSRPCSGPHARPPHIRTLSLATLTAPPCLDPSIGALFPWTQCFLASSLLCASLGRWWGPSCGFVGAQSSSVFDFRKWWEEVLRAKSCSFVKGNLTPSDCGHSRPWWSDSPGATSGGTWCETCVGVVHKEPTRLAAEPVEVPVEAEETEELAALRSQWNQRGYTGMCFMAPLCRRHKVLQI